jgi:hypothetical protein
MKRIALLLALAVALAACTVSGSTTTCGTVACMETLRDSGGLGGADATGMVFYAKDDPAKVLGVAGTATPSPWSMFLQATIAGAGVAWGGAAIANSPHQQH